MGLEGGRSRKRSATEKLTQMARNALFGAAAFTAASASDVGKKADEIAQHTTVEKKADRENLHRFDKFRRSTNVEDRRDENGYTGPRPRFIETDMNMRLAEIKESERLEKSQLAIDAGIKDIKSTQQAIAAKTQKSREALREAALRKARGSIQDSASGKKERE